jgi:signal transduction histidine kinase
MSHSTSTQAIGAQLERIRAELSRIHHDINNPISVIAGNAELIGALLEATTPDAGVEAALVDLRTAVDMLGDQVDRLLALRGLLNEVVEQLDTAS